MKKAKLLLIDDEKSLLQNLKQILEFENFEVVTAANGYEGLSQYEKESPDLVICDIMMPEMDGYGFIKTMRNKGYTSTPFIFLTAKSDYDDLREGMNFGADDYLVKPVKSSQLIDAINIRLQRKREINKKIEIQSEQIDMILSAICICLNRSIINLMKIHCRSILVSWKNRVINY